VIFEPSDLISVYTRKQAVEDGQQFRVDAMANEAGLIFPVFITAAVWSRFVSVPEDVEGQDEDGRLWDILHMLRYAIESSRPGQQQITVRVYVRVYVRNTNRAARPVTLKALCGPLDIDDPQPAITIMLPEED
jgi:hypothetical protein